MKNLFAKAFFLFVFAALFCSQSAFAFADREYYALQVYYLENGEQEQRVDRYLQQAFLPALHRMGIKKVGVFKPVGNDTSSNRRIYVLIPFKKMEQFLEMPSKLGKDKTYQQSGNEYLNAPYNRPNYKRIETTLLQAFANMPVSEKPALKSPASDRIYELRSYEGATEKLYANKVDMFNAGGEITLFKRLGFNAVFYGEVIAGCHMPNLMYMTSFENMAERDQHWKTFIADPEWKELSARPHYQKNVSHADIYLLHQAEYSDL